MKIKFIFLLFFLINSGYAQQESLFSMYWNNYSLVNPGATGMFATHYASVCGRHQWLGFDEGPRTISALYDFKWDKINSGIGINYIYDEIGFEKNQKAGLNYAYHFKLKKDQILSAGLSMGWLRNFLDFSDLRSSFAPVEKNIINDYVLLNLGSMYKSHNLSAGLGASKLWASKTLNSSYQNRLHLYLLCSNNIEVSKHLDIKPGIYVKSDLSSTQFDFNMQGIFMKRYWIGATYRSEDAFVFMAGIDIHGKYRLAYAYDLCTTDLSNYSDGSHEIALVLSLNKKKSSNSRK